MKINPNDPCSKMTIRLKLAADALKSPVLRDFGVARNLSLVDAAWEMADAMIERAKRDEGSDDGK